MKKIKIFTKGKIIQIGLKNYRKIESFGIEDFRFLETNNETYAGRIISKKDKSIKIMQILIFINKNEKFFKQTKKRT